MRTTGTAHDQAQLIRESHALAGLREAAGMHPSTRAREYATRTLGLWDQLAELFDFVGEQEEESDVLAGSRYTPIAWRFQE